MYTSIYKENVVYYISIYSVYVKVNVSTFYFVCFFSCRNKYGDAIVGTESGKKENRSGGGLEMTFKEFLNVSSESIIVLILRFYCRNTTQVIYIWSVICQI